MKHIVESHQFDRGTIHQIFALADWLQHNKDNALRGRIAASLFYEPSTRTRLSFESAVIRLGGSVIGTENGRESSSASKGETLEDSIRIVSGYTDVIILRHPDNDAAERAVRTSRVPIINAGSGSGQHPTQALIDLYAIQRSQDRIDGLRIAVSGDLKHGRAARSFVEMLTRFEDIHLYLISPPELRFGDDVKTYLTRHRISFEEHINLESVMPNVDVLYQTRIQKERFDDLATYDQLKGSYQITKKLARTMKPGAVILHPLPRVDEILPEVDVLPSAMYFKQAQYGLFVRMALLKLLFQN